MDLGYKAWAEARRTLQELLSVGSGTLEDDVELRRKYYNLDRIP